MNFGLLLTRVPRTLGVTLPTRNFKENRLTFELIVLILNSRELLLVFTIIILSVLIEFLECFDNHIFLIGVVIESIELELYIRLIRSGSVKLVQTISTAWRNIGMSLNNLSLSARIVNFIYLQRHHRFVNKHQRRIELNKELETCVFFLLDRVLAVKAL